MAPDPLARLQPRRGGPRLASIAKGAQSQDFYTPDVETDLERLIECPAREEFEKLRGLSPLSNRISPIGRNSLCLRD